MIKINKLFLFASALCLVGCGSTPAVSSSDTSSEPSVTSSAEPSEESSIEVSSEPESSAEESSAEESSSEIIPCDEHNFHIDHIIDPTEEEDGCKVYQCGACGTFETITIPKLDATNYQVTNVTVSCNHGNGKKYYNKDYGTYYVTDDERNNHTVYGDYCEECGQLVGEFKFENVTNFTAAGYPRLYQLSEYWDNAWLMGGDNGRIVVRKSTNQGLSWSKEQVVSYLPDYACANVDFFELPNYDILCCYRAIGRAEGPGNVKYTRKLHYSISRDGGDTWEDGADIVDNFELGKQLGYSESQVIATMNQHSGVGFYEPYVDFINNVPTVMYADDFTSMLLKPCGPSINRNYCAQYLMSQTFDFDEEVWSTERVAIMDGSTPKSPEGSELKERISRDGMPVFARMKDGTYVVVFEGTYRDSSYFVECGETLPEYHPFEILLSYSKDGVNWSNPVEIYTPYNNGSKASAPFVCVTSDNRLVVSFQTDEDAVPSGMIGDAYSVMKCMVSKPGIKIEDINRDSFYAVTNVNNTPVGGASLWNGMMLIDDVLFTCSTGCKVRKSSIPVYAIAEDYVGEEIKMEGTAFPVELKEDNFVSYSSVNKYRPIYENEAMLLNNSTHCEQKVILKDVELGDEYELDFTLTTDSTRDVNFGFYLGAKNPNDGADLIDALNIHLERSVGNNNFSVHLYEFGQGYRGQLGIAQTKNTKSSTIQVRIIVKENNIKVLIDDMDQVVNEYNVDSKFDLSGILGIRNQGTSKAQISNLVITVPEAE